MRRGQRRHQLLRKSLLRLLGLSLQFRGMALAHGGDALGKLLRLGDDPQRGVALLLGVPQRLLGLLQFVDQQLDFLLHDLARAHFGFLRESGQLGGMT